MKGERIEVIGTYGDWLRAMRPYALEFLGQQRPASIPRLGVAFWYLAQNKGYWKAKYGLQ